VSGAVWSCAPQNYLLFPDFGADAVVARVACVWCVVRGRPGKEGDKGRLSPHSCAIFIDLV
jgi:hypothetical protein